MVREVHSIRLPDFGRMGKSNLKYTFEKGITKRGKNIWTIIFSNIFICLFFPKYGDFENERLLFFVDFKKNRGIINKINFTIILCSVAFIFNQLITANQIFIFSLIPILAAILHYNIDKLNIDYKIFYLIIFVVIFSTFKFHIRFNIDRKFHDLENVDKSKAIEAIQIHKKFNIQKNC